MKRLFLTLTLTLLALALLIAPASAGQKHKLSLPTEGVMSADPMCGTLESNPDQATASGGLISNWSTTIRKLDSDTVNISGFTQTYSAVSSIKVTVYLQRWTGSQWVDVIGVSNSASATTYVSISRAVNVSPGYYYRSRAVHTAVNGITETINSTTSYLYI